MNIAIVLAGGVGSRIGADKPKQFIEVMGKPVLAYTLEIFQKNKKIDAIEIVCHRKWEKEVREISKLYGITKTRWIVHGGKSFQESVMNGVFYLKNRIHPDDIAVVSFGVSPMTPQEDVDDAIRVCQIYGNAIAAADIELCTCVKDNEESSTQNIIRETLKGFANPWAFRFGELCEVYEEALERGIIDRVEPHTTSLYFALGKRIFFSQYTALQAKITQKKDLDIFEGYLLLKQKRERDCNMNN